MSIRDQGSTNDNNYNTPTTSEVTRRLLRVAPGMSSTTGQSTSSTSGEQPTADNAIQVGLARVSEEPTTTSRYGPAGHTHAKQSHSPRKVHTLYVSVSLCTPSTTRGSFGCTKRTALAKTRWSRMRSMWPSSSAHSSVFS